MWVSVRNEQELHELRELVKEKDNQLRRTRQRMNNRVSQLILGMEEGEGLEALRQQLDEKEKELEEAKAKAVEEGRIQLAKVMKLVEDKGLPHRFVFLPSPGPLSLSFFWS
jgi:L-lysine 2,3-aminomutase